MICQLCIGSMPYHRSYKSRRTSSILSPLFTVVVHMLFLRLGSAFWLQILYTFTCNVWLGCVSIWLEGNDAIAAAYLRTEIALHFLTVVFLPPYSRAYVR